MSAPLPPDEAERLRTLARYDVLDTPADAALDRLTALATRLFRVPIALVTLVDRDRQWFKSRQACPVCETDRDRSFCAHAILPQNGEMLVVPDATRDARFADNPEVTGSLGLRFYAGAPLRMDNGAALGAFCIADTHPRDFSDEDRAALLDLAAAAVGLLELHASRRLVQAEAAERRRAEEAAAHAARCLSSALDGIGEPFFCLDHDWRFTYLNRHAARLLQRRADDLIGRCLWDEYPHAANSRFGQAYRRAVESGESVHLEDFSGLLNTWIEVHAYPSEDGLAVSFHDIADRKEAQRQSEDSHKLLRAIIHGTDDAIFIKDREGRYLIINPAGAAMLGPAPEHIVGHTDERFLPGGKRARQPRFGPGGHARQRLAHLRVQRRARRGRTLFHDHQKPVPRRGGQPAGHHRHRARDHRATPRRRGVARGQGGGRTGQPGQERVPFPHEPRAAHAAQRHPGLRPVPRNAAACTRRETESVGHILKAGRHLLGLIDEVLAISRIEAGRMTLSLEPVSALREMWRECI